MPYCPDCGGQLHECEVAVIDPAAEQASADKAVARTASEAEIELARINAERDIKIAKIQAGIVRDETVVEAVVAEAEADATVAAVAPEPEEDPTPVVVVDSSAEAEAEEPSIPPADEQGGDDTPVSSGKSSNPWW